MDADASVVPLELDLDRSRHLRIRWADGKLCVLPLALLRQNCPCATCRAEREARESNPLRVMKAPVDESMLVTASGAELVGRYALKLVWRDGHETGIFEFKMLRRLADAAAAKSLGSEAVSSGT